MSLFLATGLGAMSEFETKSGDEFDRRGNAIGTPDIGYGATTTTIDDGVVIEDNATTTTSAPPTPPTSTVASSTSTATANGSKWTATVVILVTDGANPIHKAKLTANWVEHLGGGGTAVTTVTCETQPNGTCTFALRDLGTFGNSHHVASVDFTVTSVTPVGGTTTNPGLITTVSEPVTT